MQRLTCVVFTNLVHYYGKRPCQCSASGQLAISLVTSFVPRLTIWYGNRTACAHAYKLQNGVLRNGQQPQSVTFIDQGEVEAIKTPIGCRDPDKNQFRAKMTVST